MSQRSAANSAPNEAHIGPHIEFLEEKEKIFKVLNQSRGHTKSPKIETIIHFMDECLQEVLKSGIREVWKADESMGKLILCAFFGLVQMIEPGECRNSNMPLIGKYGIDCATDRKKSVLSTNSYYHINPHSDCVYPLYADILAAYVANWMREKFKAVHETSLEQVFEESKLFFQKRAIDLLLNLYECDADSASAALEIDYERLLIKDENERGSNSNALPKSTCCLSKFSSCEEDPLYYNKETVSVKGCCSRSPKYYNKKESYYTEILAIAYRAKCKEFFAIFPVYRLIEERWQGGLKTKYARNRWTFLKIWRLYPSNSGALTYASYDLTANASQKELLEDRHARDFENASSSFREKIKLFCHEVREYYSTINSKYTIHLLARIFYILMYAYTLMTKEGRYIDGKFKFVVRSILTSYWEMFVVAVQLCQLSDGIIYIYRNRKEPPRVMRQKTYKRFRNWRGRISHSLGNYIDRHKFSFYRNFIIFLNGILAFAAFFLREFKVVDEKRFYIISSVCEILFHISFILATISLARYFSIYEFFAAIYNAIAKMVKTILKFLILLSAFWTVFGVISISLSEKLHMENKDSSNASWPWLIFAAGSFEIFGEIEDNVRKGVLNTCRQDFTYRELLQNSTTDLDIRCLFRSTLIPIAAFTYVFLASILLINMLTSQLTKEYEDIYGDSHDKIWKFDYYRRLARFEAKSWLPPPFPLIIYVPILLSNVLSFVIRVFNPCNRCCRCQSLRLGSSQYWKFLDWFTGRIWGVVRPVMNMESQHLGIIDEMKKLAESYGKYDISTIVIDELNDKFPIQRNENPILRARRIREEVLKIIDKYIDTQMEKEVNAAANSRAGTRAGTVLGGVDDTDQLLLDRAESRLSNMSANGNHHSANGHIHSSRVSICSRNTFPIAAGEALTPISSDLVSNHQDSLSAYESASSLAPFIDEISLQTHSSEISHTSDN